MANPINDLGNGTGILYITDSANRIVAAAPNVKEYVKQFRDIGQTVQPIAAQKASSAIITVTSASGAGSITAITINGINQIGSAITIATTNKAVLAGQIAAAINAYTPSGVKYSGQTDNFDAIIFAPESLGSTPNGTIVTITSSGGSTFSITPFAGGSSESGFVDTNLQRKFYLDSSSTAPASSISAATDITKYMVARGMQVGMITRDTTLVSDGIIGLDRGSAFTTIKMRPQTGITDTLAYINTEDFIEGDIVFLTSPSGYDINVQSAPTTTSLSAVKNIYTKDNNSFIVDQFNTLMLQYRYDTALGGIFIEMGRSIPDPSFDVEISRSAALTLAAAEGVVNGTRYLIYDVGDGIGLASGNNAGIILTGTGLSSFSADGVFLAKVPNRGLVPTMWTNVLSVSAGDRVEDWNGVYQNLTGVNTTTHPAGDVTNWSFVAKSSVYYNEEVHYCVYDITNDIIRSRADLRGNVVCNTTTVVSANELILQGFRWGTDLWYGNKVQFSQVSAGYSAGTLPNDVTTFFMSNLQGSIYNNLLFNQISCYINDNAALTANFYNNIVSLGITIFSTDMGDAHDNVVEYSQWSLDGNTLYNQNNFFYCSNIEANTNCNINSNTLSGTAVSSNSDLLIFGNQGSGTIAGNTGFSSSSGIQSCSFISGVITNNGWQTDFTLQGITIINSTIINCLFNNTAKFNSYSGTSGIASLKECMIEGLYLDGESTTTSFIQIPIEGLNINESLQPSFSVTGEDSTASVGVDYDTAFSGGTLTMPAGLHHAGEILLFNTRGGSISEIANLYPTGRFDNSMILKKTFRVISGSGVTMVPTLVGSVAGNQFASATGNVTLSRVQDSYTFKKINSILHNVDQNKLL